MSSRLVTFPPHMLLPYAWSVFDIDGRGEWFCATDGLQTSPCVGTRYHARDYAWEMAGKPINKEWLRQEAIMT